MKEKDENNFRELIKKRSEQLKSKEQEELNQRNRKAEVLRKIVKIGMELLKEYPELHELSTLSPVELGGRIYIDSGNICEKLFRLEVTYRAINEDKIYDIVNKWSHNPLDGIDTTALSKKTVLEAIHKRLMIHKKG